MVQLGFAWARVRYPALRGRLAGPALAALVLAAGCGTTRSTDTTRTATEQLLISNAVDAAVTEMDFHILSGKKVFFDPQYMSTATDHGYIVSSMRQHLLAHGVLLMEDRKQAEYIVEARCGGVGTDRHDLLVGVPQMQLPAIVPGQPSSIPEIPFAKKTDQKGVAKLAVFAYKRETGQPLWQSGVVQKSSNSKDLWVFGAGPFRRGTIRKSTEFAGEALQLPFFGDDPEGENFRSRIDVTQRAVWEEPAAGEPGAFRLAGHAEIGKVHAESEED